MRQTRTEIHTVKLKGHASSEQVHTNFLLHTPQSDQSARWRIAQGGWWFGTALSQRPFTIGCSIVHVVKGTFLVRIFKKDCTGSPRGTEIKRYRVNKPEYANVGLTCVSRCRLKPGVQPGGLHAGIHR